MQDKLILYPIFPMLALTVYVMLRTFLSRLKGVKSGTVSPKFYKTYNEGTELQEQAINSRQARKGAGVAEFRCAGDSSVGFST